MTKYWNPQSPATDRDIEKLTQLVDFDLPQSYLTMLKRFNGGKGELALSPMWLQLWSVNEVLEYYNSESHLREFPDYFFFASNGGVETIAMHKSSTGSMEIVMIDAIAGIQSVEVIAKDFGEFEDAIGKIFEK